MIREEEVEIQARLIGNKTWTKATAPFYGYVSPTDCQECAKEAIMWADEHPRKGLVDIEKVCEYLDKHLINDSYNREPVIKFVNGECFKETFISNLRKAMEGNVKIVEPDYYNGKRPYILKPEEREIVKRLLKIDDIDLNTLITNINDEGKILVRTPNYTWNSLCGREWLIDLENESHELVCMN